MKLVKIPTVNRRNTRISLLIGEIEVSIGTGQNRPSVLPIGNQRDPKIKRKRERGNKLYTDNTELAYQRVSTRRRTSPLAEWLEPRFRAKNSTQRPAIVNEAWTRDETVVLNRRLIPGNLLA